MGSRGLADKETGNPVRKCWPTFASSCLCDATAAKGFVTARYRRFSGTSRYEFGERLCKVRCTSAPRRRSLQLGGCEMKLSEGIEAYVTQKRASGLLVDHGERCFREFYRRVGDVPLSQLTTRDVLNFLDEPLTSTVTWRGKHQLLVS